MNMMNPMMNMNMMNPMMNMNMMNPMMNMMNPVIIVNMMNPMMNMNMMNMNMNMNMMNPVINVNMMNPMMNMNMVNPMMNMNMFNNQNIFNNNKMQDDEITIGIQSTDLKRFKCNKNDMAYTLKNKLGNNLNYSLTINYRAIEFNKSLKENGIYNGSIINISEKIYTLVFEKNGGPKINLSLDSNCPFSVAVIIYFNSFGELDLYLKALDRRISFLYGNKHLDINDKTPIKKIFSNYIPLINIIE